MQLHTQSFESLHTHLTCFLWLSPTAAISHRNVRALLPAAIIIFPTRAPIHALCSSIPTVCGAASETEYASLYLNAQQAYFERTCLSALGYPQPPTHLYADNSAAVGIANDTVKLKRSKAIDMRYHWIRNRFRQGVFDVSWSAGPDNIADYFTKLQPTQRQRIFEALFC